MALGMEKNSPWVLFHRNHNDARWFDPQMFFNQ